jgi:hypothetical protein
MFLVLEDLQSLLDYAQRFVDSRLIMLLDSDTQRLTLSSTFEIIA